MRMNVCHRRRPLPDHMPVIGLATVITPRIGGLNFVWCDAPKRTEQIADHLVDACGPMTQILGIACGGRESKVEVF